MPSTGYAKAKGRTWETACVTCLQDSGFGQAERRRLEGVQDRGDIAGFLSMIIECKHEKTYKLPEWVREADRERGNAKARWGFVWARQNGKPDPLDGFVIMSGRQFVDLLGEMYEATGSPVWML